MANLDTLQTIIEQHQHYPAAEVTAAVAAVLDHLEAGTLRTASKQQQWQTHGWIKQAILLAFKLFPNRIQAASNTNYFDKLPLQFADYTADDYLARKLRILPGAIIRRGCYVGENTVIMPSFINIGAYVGDNCMIDTWATIGSCAQIGNNVHIAGGTGIGGVLEPLQANPTIIEDHCFIGARSEIVEGVIIGEGSVISMGVFIGQSTKIYDRVNKTTAYGQIPPYSVVVPGMLPSADGSHSLQCAVIIKQVDAKTRAKTGINELLRYEIN